jgi:hypothetical protein
MGCGSWMSGRLSMRSDYWLWQFFILLMETSIFGELKTKNKLLLDFMVANKCCEKHVDK